MARLLFLVFALLLFQQAISEIQDNGSVFIACILFLISAVIGLYLLITILGIKDQIKRIGILERIKNYLRCMHRLSISTTKREAIVWEDLKKYFKVKGLAHGVFEQEKYIEIGFKISDNQGASFFHHVYNGNFKSMVRLLEDFPVELTSDIFILATHFNNVLNYGLVTINTDERSVEFSLKQNILLPYLNESYLYLQQDRHLDITIDLVLPAFQRLIQENEAPAIIIADLLKGTEDKSE